MGETRNEIPRLREAGDHPPGRAIPPAGSRDAGEAGDPACQVLPLVRPPADRRPRGAGRQITTAETRLEPHPEAIRKRIVQLALDEPELSPRELATRFTDTASYFVSEASVYRLLKAYDLISSPAYIVMKAADEFKDKTTAPNQLWQTDFTYLKVT